MKQLPLETSHAKQTFWNKDCLIIWCQLDHNDHQSYQQLYCKEFVEWKHFLLAILVRCTNSNPKKDDRSPTKFNSMGCKQKVWNYQFVTKWWSREDKVRLMNMTNIISSFISFVVFDVQACWMGVRLCFLLIWKGKWRFLGKETCFFISVRCSLNIKMIHF